MVPQNITIRKKHLTSVLAEGAEYFGVRGWGIYCKPWSHGVDRFGQLDLLHEKRAAPTLAKRAASAASWIKIYDLEEFIEYEDEHFLTADDDDFNAESVAERIVEDTTYVAENPSCRML